LSRPASMHPQLELIVRDFKEASERLRRLDARAGEGDWFRRPNPESWPAAECIAHLNLTSRAYLGILPEAVARARDLGSGAPARFRRDLVGWLIWKTSGPIPRVRVKTHPEFAAARVDDKHALIDEFGFLQERQIRCVE